MPSEIDWIDFTDLKRYLDDMDLLGDRVAFCQSVEDAIPDENTLIASLGMMPVGINIAREYIEGCMFPEDHEGPTPPHSHYEGILSFHVKRAYHWPPKPPGQWATSRNLEP
jgi:hypothetical protein